MRVVRRCSSAGVVLTLVIPAVSSGTVAGTLKVPQVPMGSAHGHTGHVRFLTSIELPEGFDMNFPPTPTDSTGPLPPGILKSKIGTPEPVFSSSLPVNFFIPAPRFLGNQCQSSSSAVDANLQRRDSARRRASAHIPSKSNHLVISGGDGYEDFRLTNSSETVGRDDSTNHLLLWKV